MMHRFALGVLVLLTAAGLAGATTLVKMEVSDLAKESDHVVVGTVTGLEGQWDDSLNFIHTNVTLSVERSLLGLAPTEVVVRTPGGQVGGMAQLAHGAPTFQLGERVLVFLTTWEDGTAKVLGYVQGKSRVTEAADGSLRLKGGAADDLSLESVEDELRHGSEHNIQLRPAR